MPLTVDITISEESFSTKQQSLIKESDKEIQFIEDLIQFVRNLNTTFIQNSKSLKEIVCILLIKIEELWIKHSKTVNITRHFKAWWNDDCHYTLNKF